MRIPRVVEKYTVVSGDASFAGVRANYSPVHPGLGVVPFTTEFPLSHDAALGTVYVTP